MINVALVGCGGMARYYMEVYQQLEGVRLALLVDTNTEAAREASVKMGGIRYSDRFEDCLSERIDLVDISTPNFLHKGQALAAIRAGKHVLIQKPVTVLAEEADVLAQEADRCGVKAGVYMSVRSNPVYHEMKKIIQSGAVGRITSLYARRSNPGGKNMPGGSWRSDIRKTGGGAFIQLAIHSMDISMWLLDQKIHSITCRNHNLVCENIGGEDTAAAVVEYEDRTIGCIEASYCSYLTQTNVFGTEGYLLLDEKSGNLSLQLSKSYKNERLNYDTPGVPAVYSFDTSESVLYSAENPFEQHAAFLRAVMRNEPVPVSLKEAFYDMRLVEAAYRSGRTGQTVEIR